MPLSLVVVVWLGKHRYNRLDFKSIKYKWPRWVCKKVYNPSYYQILCAKHRYRSRTQTRLMNQDLFSPKLLSWERPNRQNKRQPRMVLRNHKQVPAVHSFTYQLCVCLGWIWLKKNSFGSTSMAEKVCRLCTNVKMVCSQCHLKLGHICCFAETWVANILEKVRIPWLRTYFHSIRY